MKQISQILINFDATENRHISREFQSFGLHLAERLDDYKHKSLYIKLAKTTDRALLERALSFCIDSSAKNKGALFMWKLKELKEMKNSKSEARNSKQIQNQKSQKRK